MELLLYALLGVVQGLTEFLPVSSSGHLVLMQHWLGIDTRGMTMELVLHLATTLAVVAVFGKDVLALFREKRWGYIGLLALTCLVTVIIFVPFKDRVEAFSDSEGAPRFVGAMLLITGAWQLLADWRLRRDQRLGIAPQPLTALRSVLIGAAMACSGLFRGISRSGATIGAAIQLGVAREEAARFSFLSSVPIIIGGSILKAGDVSAELNQGTLEVLPLAVGFVASLLSGIAAIYLLLWMLRRARLLYFALYCFALGTLALVVG